MSYELIAILSTSALQLAGIVVMVTMLYRAERWRDRIDAVLLKDVGDIHAILDRMKPASRH